MANSCLHVYIHLVWHTKHRQPILRGSLESFVHRRIKDMARTRGLAPIAVNSAWNHIHALIRWNATETVGDAVGAWKAQTSRQWNRQNDGSEHLYWQTGYGAFSICRHQIEHVKNYIARQKHHHRYDTTIGRHERQ